METFRTGDAQFAVTYHFVVIKAIKETLKES